jgi:hypothetical protein
MIMRQGGRLGNTSISFQVAFDELIPIRPKDFNTSSDGAKKLAPDTARV